jgi:uncharacterized protein (DUF427 family)
MSTEADSLRVERSPKRVRALVGGQAVFDTRAALLVWEHPYYPTYYVPAADVHADLVDAQDPSGRTTHAALGAARVLDVRIGGQQRPGAALVFPDATQQSLRRMVRVKWDAMDEWLEEDEPVYVHPRDPYKRIDILASSQHVRIVVDDVTVADSRQPRILFETSLPARYYLPPPDVRMDLLVPADTLTRCPYKGDATWWSLEVDARRYDDLAWMYRAPTPESQKIAGLVAFYNERVDLYLDDELQERPQTPFA